MCAPVLTMALVAAAILSCGGSVHAHHGAFRWAPIPHHLPIDAMIEVVDRLTVDVLQDYAFSRGNFAFSPYGATSVLIALYEGSRGESARQIHGALRLPWNHDAVRIGFRDLHRRLRVYFVHEGFLNGLTFNKNKTEFRPEYIRSLRFYGYEVESVTPASLPSTTESSSTTASSPAVNSSSTEPETFSTTTVSPTESGTTINGDVTTQKQPTSPTVTESTTGSTQGNEIPETTEAVTDKSMEATTVVTYQSTKNNPPVETSDITSQSSQTTTIGMATVSEMSATVDETAESATQKLTTVTSTSATETDVSTAGGTTEGVRSTETPYENTQASVVTSEINDTTTKTSVEVTTNSESTSEQTTIVSVLSSTETLYDTTVKEIDNLTEPASTINVIEVATTEIPEIIETTTEKRTSTTDEEVVTAQPTESASPTIQLTTDETVSESAASTELPLEVAVTTDKKVATTDSIPPESPSSVDNETATTMIDVEISNTELSTDSIATTSQTTEETDTPVSVADIGETSTYSEQTSASSSTSTPDTGARSARNIFSPDSATWLGDLISFVREMSSSAGEARRIAKRSIKEGLVDRRHGDFSLQLQNGMLDAGHGRGLEKDTPQVRLPFLVDGVLEEKVAVSTYTAMLPFAFVPRLDALALELPLENDHHRLVILLPLERRGLQELIYELGSYPLGHVMRSLHQTRVNAIIPNIVVDGFVVLTPTLQKLGIWDVFDPKRADLSGMSRDPELYVRDLEQTITVDISSKSRIRELPARGKTGRQHLEQFAALHPFLYFVVDRDTKVPLVAGKMVDPFNSRIH